MKRIIRYVFILLWSCIVMFLSACSKQHVQESSVDMNSQSPSYDVPAQKTVTEPAKETEQVNQANKVVAQESASQGKSEAQQKLEFAQSNLKMAQKGILNFSQTVVICRGLIKDYPNTEYEQQARMLLREIPKDLRPQYNLTDEELGL